MPGFLMNKQNLVTPAQKQERPDKLRLPPLNPRRF